MVQEEQKMKGVKEINVASSVGLQAAGDTETDSLECNSLADSGIYAISKM